MRASTHGYLPLTRARGEVQDAPSRIEATVLHNQACGTHSVDGTQALVGSLVDAGVPLDQVALALHLDADELLRYRQRGGLLDQVDGTYGSRRSPRAAARPARARYAGRVSTPIPPAPPAAPTPRPAAPTTSPAGGPAPFDCSALAIQALGIAQQTHFYQDPLSTQGEQFSRAVDQLAGLPQFEVVAAEAAAEFLKVKAAQADLHWTRFGLRGGTYLTLLPLLLVFVTAETPRAQLISGLGLLLGLGLFLAGAFSDPLQQDLKTAEALLKAAVKRHPQRTAVPSVAQAIDPMAVERKMRQQHRRVTAAVSLLIVLFCGVVMFLGWSMRA